MDAPLSLHSVVVAAAEQVSCPLGEEAAILNLKNSVYYGMNPVGARIWELLKQPRSVGELRDALARRIRSGAGALRAGLARVAAENARGRIDRSARLRRRAKPARDFVSRRGLKVQVAIEVEEL